MTDRGRGSAGSFPAAGWLPRGAWPHCCPIAAPFSVPTAGYPVDRAPTPLSAQSPGDNPNLVSIPWGQPPNPFGVPAAGEGGAWLRVVLGVSSSPLPSLAPPPCWVTPSPGRQRLLCCFHCQSVGDERWCCGKAGKIIIKGGEGTASGPSSLPGSPALPLSSSRPFKEIKRCLALPHAEQ